MAHTVLPELERLRRQIRMAAFLRGLAEAALATAAVGAAVLVALRLFGHWFPPRAAWLWVALLPLAYAVVRAATVRTDARLLAAHLDRRFGLSGLLITGLEADVSRWQSDLDRRLQAADPRARPRLRPVPFLWRGLLAGMLVASVGMLPPPEPTADAVRSRALELAVEDLVADVELALEEGTIGEAGGRELRERTRDLRERLLAGDPVAWSDVDGLGERLGYEEEAHLGGLQSVGAAIEQMLQHLRSTGPDGLGTPELGRTLTRAHELGLLEDLPPERRAVVERALEELARQSAAQGGAGGGERESSEGLSPADLGLDREVLEDVLEHVAKGSGRRLERLDAKQRVPAADLPDLKALLEMEGILPGGGVARGAGEGGEGADGAGDAGGGGAGGAAGAGRGHGEGEGPEGAGGVARGPGDAELRYVGDSDVGTEGITPEKLPPGVAIPDDWHVLGVSRARPEVAPVRSTAAGGAAVEGAGRATFRRRLAPRHREAVQRFFSTPGSDKGGR